MPGSNTAPSLQVPGRSWQIFLGSATGTVPIQRYCLAWRQGVQCQSALEQGLQHSASLQHLGDKSRPSQVALTYKHDQGAGVSLQLAMHCTGKRSPSSQLQGTPAEASQGCVEMVNASPRPPAAESCCNTNMFCSGTSWAAGV